MSPGTCEDTQVQEPNQLESQGTEMSQSSNSIYYTPPSQRFRYPDLTSSSFAPELNLEGITPYSALECAEPQPKLTENWHVPESKEPVYTEDMFPDDADVEAELREPQAPHPPQEKGPLPTLEGPFRSPRGFHITPENMKAALEAPAGSEASHWRYTLYKGPNEADPDVKVHYCSTKDQMERFLREYFQHEEVVGFDLEWKYPAYGTQTIKQSVSLIQIANEERIGLFHLARFAGERVEDFVSPTLKAIVESPDVLKCGVAIKGDCTRLRKHLGLECQGQFELSHIYKLVKFHRGQEVDMNKRLRSLKDQAQDVFGLPLLKDEVRTSDWSLSKALSKDQCKYAANDAYACFQLFHHMDAARLLLDPVPPRPAHAERDMPLLDKPIRKVVINDLESDSSEGSFGSWASISSEEEVDEVDEVSSVLANMEICSDDSAEQSESDSPSSEASSPEIAAIVTPRSEVPTSTEFTLATTWAQLYIADRGKRPGTSPANLRAYHLWHHQNLDVLPITAILRDPPLKPRTVIDYICEAVCRGDLPAVPDRFVSLGTLGVEPLRDFHKKMLRRATVEAGRRQGSQEVFDDATDTRWWKDRV